MAIITELLGYSWFTLMFERKIVYTVNVWSWQASDNCTKYLPASSQNFEQTMLKLDLFGDNFSLTMLYHQKDLNKAVCNTYPLIFVVTEFQVCWKGLKWNLINVLRQTEEYLKYDYFYDNDIPFIWMVWHYWFIRMS